MLSVKYSQQSVLSRRILEFLSINFQTLLCWNVCLYILTLSINFEWAPCLSHFSRTQPMFTFPKCTLFINHYLQTKCFLSEILPWEKISIRLRVFWSPNVYFWWDGLWDNANSKLPLFIAGITFQTRVCLLTAYIIQIDRMKDENKPSSWWWNFRA